jgi:hypothetical protein
MSEFSGIDPDRLLSTIKSLGGDRDQLNTSIGWIKPLFEQHGLSTQPLTNLTRIRAWVEDQLPLLHARHDLTVMSDKPYPGFNGMIQVDEKAVSDNATRIALRLLVEDGGPHPINITPEEYKALKAAAAETGISENLLLSITWQEQQWYQNMDDYGLFGDLMEDTGHVFDWGLEESVVPDKSLGITHMKLATARAVMSREQRQFTVNGKFLGDLSDSQLTKYIEENPGEDIRLSAHYLAQLKQNPYGARTDKQLFLLYAADTPQVRAANALYGDATAPRKNDMHTRAANWDKLHQPLLDSQAWAGLTDAERQAALNRLSVDLPKGQSMQLGLVFDPSEKGVPGSLPGSGPVPPGIPTPTPGPPPVAPKD